MKKNVLFLSHYNRRCFVIIAVLVFSSCVNRFSTVRPEIEMIPSAPSQEKAQEYFIKANDYERRGLLKMAAREYENALQFDPGSKLLRRQLTALYIALGKYTQAVLLVKNGRKNEALSREEKRILSTVYLKMGEVEKAAWILETITEKSAEELYTLGWIYEHLGSVKKALPYFQRYFTMASDALPIGKKIVSLLIQLNLFAEADSFCTLLNKADVKSADVFSLRGSIALLRGDTAIGILMFDSALVLDSLHEETLRSRAQLFIERMEYTPAIACYRKLIRQFSYGDVYTRTLALLYYHNKQFGEAESLLVEMLKNLMNDPQLHYYLGLVYVGLEKKDLAAIEFEKSLSVKSDEVVWRELCSLFIKNDTFDRAAAVAKRYTLTQPDSKAAWRLRGYVATLQKNYDEAILWYKKAVAIDSSDAGAWFEIASSFERNKMIDSAEISFYKVLHLQPEDPGTLNYMGYMWAEQGVKLDSARNFLVRALEKEPRNGAFLDSYAWIFYQMGEFDSAFHFITLAIELIAEDPIIYSHLGDILLKKGDLESALMAFRRSIDLNDVDDEVVRAKVVELEILLHHE